jgi:exopolyphosphatase/guanosine-5'-triphosphate,3'-diphosphate pyrophosphatase
MRTLAALDIGSNAIRLVIGEVDQYGDVRIVKKIREPVRLGKDAFGLDGILTEKTRTRAVATFVKFAELLKSHDVRAYKAVATSALREAKNRDEFLNEIRKASGLKIEVIDGIEEGRLIYSAVAHRVNLSDKTALLIDIGGGSVELTIVDHGKMKATQSFRLGTVRMLQLMTDKNLKETQLADLIREQMGPAKAFLAANAKGIEFDMAIGTGGNFECLGKLRVALLHRNSIFSMTRDELGELITHLQSMSVRERIQYLRLRPDRADVVVPASLVTQAVLEAADVEVLMIPYVGLRDGILAELGAKSAISAVK